MKRLVIDHTDTLGYMAAHAAEPIRYYVGEESFKTQKKAKEYLESDQNLALETPHEEFVKQQFLYPPDAIHPITSSILKAWIRNCNDALEGTSWEGAEFTWCLSGEKNFRKEHDQEYKANRTTKPFHIKDILRWLSRKLSPVIIQNFEADDVVAAFVDMDINNNLLVHIDKDMDNIPGWHMNSKTFSLYQVTREEALRHFLIQLIMGDSTDNIKGVPGKGKVAAKKVLESIDLQENLPYVWESFLEIASDELSTDMVSPGEIRGLILHALPLIDVGGYYTRRLANAGLVKPVVDYKPIREAYLGL